jgi:hypothetical protein
MLALALAIAACNAPAVVSLKPERDAAADVARDASLPEWYMPAPDAGPWDVPTAPTCVNLPCQRPRCAGSSTTSLSGTVFTPNGKLPLYNVAVYVPNAPLAPLPVGMTCDRCGTTASGKPIASAISDAQGRFRIDNVPAGKDIPLVIQVGKWRRQVTIPEVRPCMDNPITDPQLTRLPRNRREGDLPRVAITTGQCDGLACTMAKLGVDASEMGVMGQDRPFTYFLGNSGAGPAGMAPARALWDDPAELAKYDFLVLNCVCKEFANNPAEVPNRNSVSFDAVTRYLNAGGRAFASDFEYVWAKYSPDPRLAGAIKFTTPETKADGDRPITIDTGTPKSKALADWMKFVDPAALYGEIPAREVFDNLRRPPAGAQIWASSPSSRLGKAEGIHPRVVTFNTPVGAPADQQCGRFTFFDLHLSEPVTAIGDAFPSGCGAELTKAENALAFFLFDLAACIQEDNTPPAPPVIIP